MKRGFHVMAKPIGPICNLDCAYCYYLEKEHLYPPGEPFRMPDQVLEAYIRQYIDAQPGPVVSFAWQGGEPTLMGIAFFRRVVELQRRYAPPGKSIRNAIQTNGLLLDDDWCRLFKEEGFLVGVSLDGPPHLHDRYRRDRAGRATADRVERAVRLLQKHGVDFNVLCVVHRANADHPLEVYRYFKELGVTYIQFIPLVEPVKPGGPISYEEALRGEGVSERSVLPEQFGRFLVAIFYEWLRDDVGRVFVQIFEESVAVAYGIGASLCVFQETCGRALVLEHNGDLFSCDHFVRPEHFLGNILKTPMAELAQSPAQFAFGKAKRDALPGYCRSCPVLDYCHGECPKNRIILAPDGEPGLNYLCAGYRAFFEHARPWVRRIAHLLWEGRPASLIRDGVAADERVRHARVGRNDPCACGSGKKYKHCCLRNRS